MGLLDDCIMPKRTVYIYFLMDCSVNMKGLIGSINGAMETVFQLFNKINAENPDCNLIIKIIKVSEEPSITTYSGNHFKWEKAATDGNFFFGKAISLLTKDIRDNFDAQNFDPIFILMSGSSSADWWQPSLKRLYNLDSFDWGHKLAIKIGNSADNEMLMAFTKNKDCIFSVHNVNLLKNAIHLTWSYPEWYVCGDDFTGCSGDMALIIDKAVELNGKDILLSPKIIHILKDYQAFNSNKSLCFIFKTIQNDDGFIQLLNSQNWLLDSLNFSNKLHQNTGIDKTSIQYTLNSIGFALNHTIPIEYGLEKS